eukprot:TRINITY_DN11805_c0_g1_i1.p2 TRINITY_DN11805_c0_g1~~TRINITY_DN11805_c0_g1_i1.p2  ORF type:complete len:206 (-),score=54.50 TRINITY_DN11805_c0_g1_i1:132-749(-)
MRLRRYFAVAFLAASPLCPAVAFDSQGSSPAEVKAASSVMRREQSSSSAAARSSSSGSASSARSAGRLPVEADREAKRSAAAAAAAAANSRRTAASKLSYLEEVGADSAALSDTLQADKASAPPRLHVEAQPTRRSGGKPLEYPRLVPKGTVIHLSSTQAALPLHELELEEHLEDADEDDEEDRRVCGPNCPFPVPPSARSLGGL